NEGAPELLKAICGKLEKDNRLSYASENILVSNGAKHSIYNVVMSLCNPGDEVIIQSPYWVSYPEIIKLANAKPVVINASVENDFKITPKELEAVITPKTKAFIFCSPSNPTGAVYSIDEITKLAEVLKRHSIYVISDEIYEKVIFDGEKHYSMAGIDGMKEKTIVVNGVSKAYAMTGWRIGYAAGPKDIIKLARNLQSHSTSNACSISQAAAAAALREESDEMCMMVEEFKNRRDFIVKNLNEIKGIKCPLPKGAFYVFFDVSSFYGKTYNSKTISNSSEFCEYLLEEEKVGLVPGGAFGNDKCVRMSYACAMDELVEGVSRIKKAAAKLA
ncbi:MAG TPA: pyridoxal phosphate-dependent aminotransferase, partial [Ignavibacteriales bacterium]|nr:pyridoxal phosphate-dependent aminotransferase [Ignavibacteriales bacterium]